LSAKMASGIEICSVTEWRVYAQSEKGDLQEVVDHDAGNIVPAFSVVGDGSRRLRQQGSGGR
jgi:hypothetical protein